MPGYVCGFLTGEKGCGGRNVIDAAQSTQRDRLEKRLEGDSSALKKVAAKAAKKAAKKAAPKKAAKKVAKAKAAKKAASKKVSAIDTVIGI